jgi:hypothetical protein
MVNFFEEIIRKDQKEFMEKHNEELKERSAHLEGYLMGYLQEPNCF